MKIFGLEIGRAKKSEATPEASGFVNPVNLPGYGYYNQVFTLPYDGEKDLGEMGPIRKYVINHSALRLRSWQLYLESDVCQALFKRSTIWGIGTGLKLESEPITQLLKGQKITINTEKFNNAVEARFRTFAASPICDYSGVNNLKEIATDAWINCEVGGDVLLVLRIVNDMPKVQIIDGAHVRTPLCFGTSTGMDILNPDNNNVIRSGVEINKQGKQVAYWVHKGTDVWGNNDIGSYERIEASAKGYPYSQMACLIYGLKYRLDNIRGIPLISAVMETAAKMARYREATLGSAEERQKIVYTVEHGRASTGEGPAVAQTAAASGFGPATDIPADSQGNILANKVAATTNKMTFNLTPDSKLVSLDSKQELGFKDFYNTNFDLVCAVAGYPPEVILSKYDSNYSASRAAIKDFEHTLDVKRSRFADQFYQIIYNFCLDYWILDNVIDAPGYLEALRNQDQMTLAAYRNARWLGDTVPHIDPYKEIQAVRALLGKDSENYPLATMEDAIQKLGISGDWKAVLSQYADELKEGEKVGIEKVLQRGEQPEQGSEGIAPTPTPKPAKNGNPRK